jgi:Winged helix-turn helix
MTGNLWDGKTSAEWLRRNWAVELSVRQCQRLFRQLGFRQRKPRPLIAHADPLLQEARNCHPQRYLLAESHSVSGNLSSLLLFLRGNLPPKSEGNPILHFLHLISCSVSVWRENLVPIFRGET